MVAREKSGVDRNNEPALERSGAGDPRRVVRDVSTSLDMTESVDGKLLPPGFPARLSLFLHRAVSNFARDAASTSRHRRCAGGFVAGPRSLRGEGRRIFPRLAVAKYSCIW